MSKFDYKYFHKGEGVTGQTDMPGFLGEYQWFIPGVDLDSPNVLQVLRMEVQAACKIANGVAFYNIPKGHYDSDDE